MQVKSHYNQSKQNVLVPGPSTSVTQEETPLEASQRQWTGGGQFSGGGKERLWPLFTLGNHNKK